MIDKASADEPYLSSMSVNNTHHSLLKILFASTLCLVMVSALAAAVFMTKGPQSVDSQASVKKGIVNAKLDSAAPEYVVNKPITLSFKMNTNQAVINNAAFGFRFKGVPVKELSYVPAVTNIFKMTQTPVLMGKDSDPGINVMLTSMDGRLVGFQNNEIARLTFVPTTVGPLTIYFDPNYSHVYQAVTAPKPTAMPPMTPTPRPTIIASSKPSPVPSPYVTARPVPSYAPGTEFPRVQTQETIVVGDPQPPQQRIDILQTPDSLTLNIIGATNIPSPSPTIACSPDGSCPAGYTCTQPPMPPCPSGKMCPQVMPQRVCVPGLPSPRPTSMPTYYPSPRPTSMPTYYPTPMPTSYPSNKPSPKPTAMPTVAPFTPMPGAR